MEIKTIDAKQAVPLLKRRFRWLTQKLGYAPGLLPIHQQLLLGKSRLLKNRFQQKVWGAYYNDQLVAALPLFYPKASGEAIRVANLLIDPNFEHLGDEIISSYQAQLNQLSKKWLGPIYGHFCLGISVPEDSKTTPSFLTSHDWGWDRKLLAPVSSKTSTLVALRTPLDQASRAKVRATATTACPPGFTVRPFRRFKAKQDARIYNSIANRAMTKHPDFDPLTEKEDWELLRNSLLAIVPRYFLFLVHDGIPIGFCWGIPDYQEALRGKHSTLGYMARLLTKSDYKMGRIIYSCVLPEYQGKGLCKLVRHRVVHNMIEDGIQTIESSYIHSDNINSLSNAGSTGAEISHRFNYFHS